jgi:hypothetical protein
MTMTPPKAVPPKARVRLEPRPRPEARPGRARGRAAVLDAPRQDRARSAAAQRGYARKAQRQASAGPRGGAARRTPFVLLVMALLAAGLITSLWLSTAAAGDSYRLDSARREARDLTERAEQLRQDVAAMQTAPQLAQRARDLGMVPVGEPARLVRQPDGTVVVVGKPAPATGPAPVVESPAAPADLNEPPAQQPPAQQPPEQRPPAQQPPAQQPPAQQPPEQRPPPAGGG